MHMIPKPTNKIFRCCFCIITSRYGNDLLLKCWRRSCIHHPTLNTVKDKYITEKKLHMKAKNLLYRYTERKDVENDDVENDEKLSLSDVSGRRYKRCLRKR